MRRLDTLYLRLALVLAAALAAGFGTMAWVFHRHDNDTRSPGAQSGMASQIKLVEHVLALQPDADLATFTDLTLSRDAPPASDYVLHMPHGLQQRLAAELGHPLDLRPAGESGDSRPDGVWLRLNVTPPRWLLLQPPHRPPGPAPWTWGLLVSFAIVLVGGMALLWRVQVPMRRLEKALRQIGPAGMPAVLDVHGPREVASLAEQFNLMTARLRRHEEDREEMLAGVAHDLRAPLTRLRLLLELEPVLRQQDILRNVDSVEAIVDQFLLFARGAGGEPVSEVDLPAFLAEIVSPYEANHVNCILSPAAARNGEAILAIRPSTLRRAVCNLIDNALEYGAAPVSVTLDVTPSGYAIVVSDGGPGIPAEQRAQAMRPFTRLDSSRLSQGHCGLGLAIAARIAEVHSGHLALQTSAAGGLAAILHLPAKIAA